MSDQPPAKPDPNDAKYSVEAFKILSDSNLKPEDDPSEWIYPEPEPDPLCALVEDIIRYDSPLTDILTDIAIGETPKSQMLRKVCAWNSMMGGRATHGDATKAPREPWLA